MTWYINATSVETFYIFNLFLSYSKIDFINYIFYRNVLSFAHPLQILEQVLWWTIFEDSEEVSWWTIFGDSEEVLWWTISGDWIRKVIVSSSVSSISRFFFLQSCPIWYTNEWTEGVISTRKHAHSQEKWTFAGTKANVSFTIISPPNLFIVVNIVGGFKFIIMIWKAIRDIKAVNKTIRSKETRNVNRSHPWHLSKKVTLLTSLFPGLLTNMS